MTSVLFLVKSEKTPSSRIRVVDLIPELNRHGVEPVTVALPSGKSDRRAVFRQAAEYPVTVLQKRLLSLFDFRELRKRARRLVFDFDDAIYLKNASPAVDPKAYDSPTRRRKFKRTVLKSDAVIAANHVLATAVRSVAPDVRLEIVPSPVDVDAVEEKADYDLPAKPVLGWVGTTSTLRYLDLIAPALRELRGRRDFVLRVVADESPDLEGIEVDFIPWTLETERRELPKFDVGLMPLSSDPFSEGKAAYKLLLYLAAGVPAVASPVGMNAEVSEGETNCLSPASPDGFAEAIGRLLDDGELRRRLGSNGRKRVEETYSIPAVGAKLAAFLKHIA